MLNGTNKDIEQIDIGLDLLEKFNFLIKENCIHAGLLSDKFGLHRTHFYEVLSGKRKFSEKMRKRLNDFFNTNY